MVLQSDFIENLTDWISTQTFSISYGEASTVDYEDNSLTTTHLTKTTDITITDKNPIVKFFSELDSDEANSNTINAVLILLNGESMGKFLHNNETKTANVAIQYSTQFIVIPDFS